MRTRRTAIVLAGLALWMVALPLRADVLHMGPGLTSLETVPVGDPGNVGELSGAGAGGYGEDRICGAVPYAYNIGKYEVTAGQYSEFLNAVADTDTYGLYNTSMWSDPFACKIERNGSPGSYTYSVASDYANRPVNFVSWGDSARFANWLHNGQPTGAQGLATTDDGAYFLNGATSNAALLGVSREADWKWAITSEDEWYKAAYHKNDGATDHYWDWPTGTDNPPSNDLLDPDAGNNANFDPTDFTIGSPYYRTLVGDFENSESPYGTFDQGGNVWEWNEAILYESSRGLRGGSFHGDRSYLRGLFRNYGAPTYEAGSLGFRVSEVPEPATICLLALGGLGVLRRRVRRGGKAVAMALVAAMALGLAGAPVSADVFNLGGTRNPDGSWTGTASLETVPVGDPGNAGELSGAGAGGFGPDRICGAVAYTYNIGKYEVTAGQYTEFLNAVADIDTYGLYNTQMLLDSMGCKIQRIGSSGSYTYSVASDYANRPVNYVSWGDSARFANWLHNGQPTGAQGLSTTEDGAYYLNGATTDAQLLAVNREADWKWAITSEDEWYKAAYYKGGGTNAGYWDYPTSSNTVPGRDMADASGNNANYYSSSYLLGSPYYRTVVGEFQNSDSPYGTFDQGGNVWEWNEAILFGSWRGLRGGSWGTGDNLLASDRGSYGGPTSENYIFGFRVSQVPEPGTICLLALGGLGVIGRLIRRRRQG